MTILKKNLALAMVRAMQLNKISLQNDKKPISAIFKKIGFSKDILFLRASHWGRRLNKIPRQLFRYPKFLLEPWGIKGLCIKGLLFSRSALKKALRVINWAFVIGFIVFGLVLLGTFWKIGIVFVLAGILISPYMNELLGKKLHVNYPLSTKVIVALLNLSIATVLLMYETNENLFLLKFSIQTVGLDYEDEEQLQKLRAYLDKDAFQQKNQAYLAIREKYFAELQHVYDNADYQEVITQGTPYVEVDSQLRQLVFEARKKLEQAQIEMALKEVPKLLKAGKYQEAYRMAAPLKEVPALRKVADKTKKQIDKKVAKLWSWYKQGFYKPVIKKGTPYIEFDCRIEKLVLDAKKARAIKNIAKQTKKLIEARRYQKAIKVASQSEYAGHPELQTLIKRAKYRLKKSQEKKILARLRYLPQTQLEAHIIEYTNLVKLFPQNEKYQQKLAYYKRQLVGLRQQPPLLITQQEYGNKWPFTVQKGKLECFPPGIVTFSVGEQTYAINGLASSRGYPVIDELWRTAPNQEGLQPGSMFVIKVDMGSIINKGLDLCNPPL
ncbi:MAG TPA: DUF2511 domain-containing protein [Thioploca sp.]|nr:MAG: hypothetical protein DRR19_01115 [Gammaproteobacteria bacterium]HDN26268.1 DUF2511 domain-containing protein [Thioploca sp.]